MKEKLLLVVLLLTYLLTSSCDSLVYTPEEEPFTEVPLPEIDMTVDLNNARDTILVAEIVKLKYTIDLKGKKLKNIEVFLDSTLVNSTTSTSEFIFDTKKYKDGVHNLNIKVLAYSGSGSLADKLNSEFLIMNSNWQMRIYNDFFKEPFKIDSIYLDKGSLRLEWKSYPFYNFQEIIIYRSGIEFTNYFEQGRILNNETNFWYDTTFVGGVYKYKLVAKLYDKSITSEEKVFEDIPKLLPLEIIDENRIKIRWERNKYYKNFNKYILLRTTPYRYAQNKWFDADDIAILVNITDTSFIDKPGFGNEVVYVLGINKDVYVKSVSNAVSGHLGKKINNGISEVQYVPSINSLYINGKDRLDPNTLEILNSESHKVSVSLSGNHAFTNNLQTYGQPHSFTKVDPFTLQPIGEILYTDNLLGYYSTNRAFMVTENMYCLYIGYRYKKPTLYTPPALVLLNTNPPEIIAKDSAFSSGFNPYENIIISKLTDEGEYIIVDKSHLYNLKGKVFTKLREAAVVDFTNSGKEYVSQKNKTIYVYRCSDNALINSFDIGADFLNIFYEGTPNIDKATGFLGASIADTSVYRIYDLTDGSVVREIKISNGVRCYLANSTLFSHEGYYMKLDKVSK